MLMSKGKTCQVYAEKSEANGEGSSAGTLNFTLSIFQGKGLLGQPTHLAYCPNEPPVLIATSKIML